MKKKTNYLDKLNPAQRRAVEHGSGPALVIAGAGSGKTSVVAHRVAHLLNSGADPLRTLLLTFTKSAATEMKERVSQIVSEAKVGLASTAKLNLPWAGTFHGIAAKLLRKHASLVGLNPAFTILDRPDSEDLLDRVRERLGVADQFELFPKKATCLAIYSRQVNSGTPLGKLLKTQFRWCMEWKRELRKLFRGYVTEKQAQHVLDYDDLLLYWAELLGDRRMAKKIGRMFDHVLIDEYQDTNVLQAKILKRLKPSGHGVMVVGDDAQAIYGFRAAEIRNILDFPKLFSPRATVIKLEQNYRSTRRILKASNSVMRFAQERFTKDLFSVRMRGEKPSLIDVGDEYEQAECVASAVLRNREDGQALQQQAVLVRSARHSAVLEFELARRKIPFVKVGGMKFTDAAHVKDIMAVLRWIENPADQISSFRVLQLLPGVGPATAAKALVGLRINDPLATLRKFKPPTKAVARWRDLLKLLKRLHSSKVGWPTEVALVRAWYQPLLEHHYDEVAERIADLTQLEGMAATFKSRRSFLTDLTLDPKETMTKQGRAEKTDDDYLTISTIHSAKGREWKSVFLLNAVDGCLPSSRSETDEEFEEERRLLYVAMTRAKDQLSIVVPRHVHSRAATNNFGSPRTQFIPDAILGRFTEVRPTAHQDDEDCSVGKALIAFDLPGRIKALN